MGIGAVALLGVGDPHPGQQLHRPAPGLGPPHLPVRAGPDHLKPYEESLSDKTRHYYGCITALDEELIRLLALRTHHVRRLSLLKKRDQRPVHDPEREAELEELYRRRARRLGLDEEGVVRVFRAVWEGSKALQRASRGEAA